MYNLKKYTGDITVHLYEPSAGGKKLWVNVGTFLGQLNRCFGFAVMSSWWKSEKKGGDIIILRARWGEILGSHEIHVAKKAI